jgi:hypothetical protein
MNDWRFPKKSSAPWIHLFNHDTDFILGSLLHLEDGCSTFLRNISKILPDHTA